MRKIRGLAAVSVLALALAACSGGAEDEGAADPAAEETAAPAETSVEGDAATPAAEETPAVEASAEATATPTPTPSASASTPAARPTQVAAAAPAGPPAAFTQCTVCHSVQAGQNGIGPSLAGVVGRRSGSAAGFSYTPDMRALNLTWNEANLNRFLTNPSAMVPDTTMAIGPLNATERTAIINYLKTL